jgi:hypothetical protein
MTLGDGGVIARRDRARLFLDVSVTMTYVLYTNVCTQNKLYLAGAM